MKEILQKIVATLGTLSVILFPQTFIGAEEAAGTGSESSTGSAAGRSARSWTVGEKANHQSSHC